MTGTPTRSPGEGGWTHTRGMRLPLKRYARAGDHVGRPLTRPRTAAGRPGEAMPRPSTSRNAPRNASRTPGPQASWATGVRLGLEPELRLTQAFPTNAALRY